MPFDRLSAIELTEFLDALGKRYVNLSRRTVNSASEQSDDFRMESMNSATSVARFAHVIAERPRDVLMYSALSVELSDSHVVRLHRLLDDTGILEVLDSYGAMIFQNITRLHIPPEDIEILRDSGISSPDAEIVIAIRLMRSQKARKASEVLIQGQLLLEEASAELKQATSYASRHMIGDFPLPPAIVDDVKKPRRYFNGIGRILSGVAAGTGNVLVGIGAIPAAGDAAVAGVIASAALSIGLIGQGIGDLRGE
jgi:hypothetical protein